MIKAKYCFIIFLIFCPLGAFAQVHSTDLSAFTVLRYSSTSSGNWGRIFAKQMRQLKNGGYTALPLDKALIGWRDGKPKPFRAVSVTFSQIDDSFVTVAVPILDRLNIPYTIFVSGDNDFESLKKLKGKSSKLSFAFEGNYMSEAASMMAKLGLTGRPLIFLRDKEALDKEALDEEANAQPEKETSKASEIDDQPENNEEEVKVTKKEGGINAEKSLFIFSDSNFGLITSASNVSNLPSILIDVADVSDQDFAAAVEGFLQNNDYNALYDISFDQNGKNCKIVNKKGEAVKIEVNSQSNSNSINKDVKDILSGINQKQSTVDCSD